MGQGGFRIQALGFWSQGGSMNPEPFILGLYVGYIGVILGLYLFRV